MRGVFIVFEGIDGSGKTTQINILYKNLLQHNRIKNQPAGSEYVLLTREPGGTATSELIRNILLNPANDKLCARTEALLYAAARAQHVEERIRPALSSGKIVICDRFIDSSLAYQGYGRGQDLSFLHNLNQLAAGGLKPDLTILLDLPVGAALKRLNNRQVSGIEKDRLESEAVSFYERVREGYLKIAGTGIDNNSAGSGGYLVVNADQELNKVSDRIIDGVGNCLPKLAVQFR
ncbi:thymidylate kinase [Desulfofarcimen acetoxidans DSM 771]|uniref:Thymidylate kinase n=1 Tax=Desulfofarcimen acetoxidans (strain ATCC 49208 / DSM 771 / KCTC 5769 / VKM B-1644 / 5575) TaxID=485916 RepID=C8W2Q7_DESAS|nr:dTMP kinase [Desulfofarcimen acetoxidans]ACV61063.1 thymidylate kinase [Desulfofarcimen acetoxidans DSM 771]